jgi:hypothetical protein
MEAGLIARAELKLSNINKLLRFFILNKSEQVYGDNQAMTYGKSAQ